MARPCTTEGSRHEEIVAAMATAAFQTAPWQAAQLEPAFYGDGETNVLSMLSIDFEIVHMSFDIYLCIVCQFVCRKGVTL